MKAEEIKKAAEEYANSLGLKESHSTAKQLIEYAVEDFSAGVEFANKYWQELFGKDNDGLQG